MDNGATLLAEFLDYEPETEDFQAAVLEGLSQSPKTLPCKFFYDVRGSHLFDRICELPEYYPTRTEIGILETIDKELASRMGGPCQMIELGSGASVKVRKLLEAHPGIVGYAAVEISKDHLLNASKAVAHDFPRLEVSAVCADYTRPFRIPEVTRYPEAKKVGFFPGSTIGNFPPKDAKKFLNGIAHLLGEGNELIIGVDLKKNEATLNAAYNDAEGVTAAFNLNLLTRINRELDADIDLPSFRHHAFYNREKGCIEMHLQSLRGQEVTISGRQFAFAEGETIHTESSFKYSIEEFQALAEASGFECLDVWTDPEPLFSVHYLRVN
jgi:dimethylhistidine N-methyltransferase